MANSRTEISGFDFGDVKIVFEYPPRSDKDEEVKMEVKSIMTSVLREHLLLQKTS